MSQSVYKSRRNRRCVLGDRCPLGGKIKRGQWVVRTSPHLYFHDSDFWEILEALPPSTNSLDLESMMMIVTEYPGSMNSRFPIIETKAEHELALSKDER